MFRSFIVLTFYFVLPGIAEAQRFNKSPLWYLSARARMGNFYGTQLSGAAIVNIRHELSVGYEAVFRRSTSFPEDYDCPTCIHGPGNDFVSGLSLSYGYAMYPLVPRFNTRIVLRGGLLIGEQSSYGNFRPVLNPGPQSDNYEFDRNDRFSVGAFVNPTLDIGPVKAFGISVGPFGFVSGNFVGAGLSIGTLLGHVNYANARTKRPMH